METQAVETAVVVAENNKLALRSNGGFSEGFDSSDLLLPKVLLMQGLSRMVGDAKAVMGEMRDSIEGKLLGTPEQPVECIPLHMNKSWILFKNENGKLQYNGQVPLTADNKDWEWEVLDKNGNLLMRRDKCINVFCILVSDLAEDSYLPHLISFRRTSFNAGRKLFSRLESRKQVFNKALESETFKLACFREKNDKGVFFVQDVIKGRPTTPEEQAATTIWKGLVHGNKVKIDDSDLVQESAPVAPAHNPSVDYKRFEGVV